MQFQKILRALSLSLPLTLTLTLTLLAHTASAYPITPRPLRKLVTEAEFIVIAHVSKITREETSETDFFGGTMAHLEIREVLQGNLDAAVAKVSFNPGIVCPAPAHYAEGTTVVAFLTRAGDVFRTHAMSYGAKTVDADEASILKDRILEMQAILKVKNDWERTSQTLDWLIACAEHPVTRWDGLYELSPESDFMSYYDRDGRTRKEMYSLSAAQKARLRGFLFASEKLSYHDMGLIDLLARRGDTELIAFLSQQMKAADPEEMWFAEHLMSRIVALTEREDLAAIVDEMEAIGWQGRDYRAKQAAVIRKFQATL